MTNERAIELLHRLQDEQFDGIHGDERREALSMAVRALEPNLGQKTIDCIIKRLNGEDTAQPTQTNADSTQTNALDCVSRQAAIDVLDKHIDTFDVIDTNYLRGLRTAMSFLKKMPSAQPERKKGKWIRHITTGLGPKLNDTIECSECRIAFSTENMFRRSFCPNCGADMRGENDD